MKIDSKVFLVQSEQVGQAVYSHDWFRGGLRYRKLLLLIIKRAQRPSYLKATQLLNMSLVTVTAVSSFNLYFLSLPSLIIFFTVAASVLQVFRSAAYHV